MVLSSIMGLFRDVARWKEVWNEEEGSAADALLYYLSFPFLEITVIEATFRSPFTRRFFHFFFFFFWKARVQRSWRGIASSSFLFEVSIFGYSKRGFGILDLAR